MSEFIVLSTRLRPADSGHRATSPAGPSLLRVATALRGDTSGVPLSAVLREPGELLPLAEGPPAAGRGGPARGAAWIQPFDSLFR